MPLTKSLHTVASKVVLTTGLGLTFTVTVCAALKHPLATDLMVYTTLPVVFVVTKLNAVLIAPAPTGTA